MEKVKINKEQLEKLKEEKKKALEDNRIVYKKEK